MIGPFRPAAYLTAYAFIALPNAFVATAIQFSLAARSGRRHGELPRKLAPRLHGLLRRLAPAVQARAWGRCWIRSVSASSSKIWRICGRRSRRTSRLVGLEGAVLTNRLLWLGIASGGSRVHLPALSLRPSHREHLVEAQRRDAGDAQRRRMPDAGDRRHGERADLRPAGPRGRSASPSTRVRRSPSRGLVPNDREELGRTRPAGRPSRC